MDIGMGVRFSMDLDTDMGIDGHTSSLTESDMEMDLGTGSLTDHDVDMFGLSLRLGFRITYVPWHGLGHTVKPFY